MNYCRTCKTSQCKFKHKIPAEERAYHTARRRKYAQTPRGRERIRLANRRAYQKHKHKAQARAKLNRALLAGTISKPILCTRCSLPRKLQAHHHDYTKPLDVRWVCTGCHADIEGATKPRRKPNISELRRTSSPYPLNNPIDTKGFSHTYQTMQTRRPHFEDHSSKIQRRTDLHCRILLELDPETRFKIIATNVLPALIPQYNEQSVRKAAGELARRPVGDTCPFFTTEQNHLYKCEPDKNGKCTCPTIRIPFECPHKPLSFHVFSGKNITDVRHYYRTQAGDQYLRDAGYSVATLRYRPHGNPHQALVDLWKASLIVGLRSSSLVYKPWHVYQEKDIPARNSKHPARLYLDPKTYYVPDDKPFSLSNENGGTLFLLELDRGTENQTVSDDKVTLDGKIDAYKQLLNAQILQQFYGAKSIKVIWVTTSEARRRTILKRIAHHFPNGCHFMIVGLIEDHIKQARKPNFNTTAFTQHYLRHNHPPFSLATLDEVTTQEKTKPDHKLVNNRDPYHYGGLDRMDERARKAAQSHADHNAGEIERIKSNKRVNPHYWGDE